MQLLLKLIHHLVARDLDEQHVISTRLRIATRNRPTRDILGYLSNGPIQNLSMMPPIRPHFHKLLLSWHVPFFQTHRLRIQITPDSILFLPPKPPQIAPIFPLLFFIFTIIRFASGVRNRTSESSPVAVIL